MSLLSESAQEELVAQLAGNAVETGEEPETFETEPESDAEIEEPEEEASELEADSEPGADVSAEAETEEGEEEEEVFEAGHRVPYDRFKQINDRRKHLEEQMGQRDRMIEEMKERLNQNFGQQSSPEPEAEQYDGSEYQDEGEDTYLDSRIRGVMESNSRLEVKFARMELEREISSAQSTHPGVPEGYLWDSVARDGSVDVMQAAAHYTSFVAEIEEAAIARHLEELRGMEKSGKASAPPRPASRKSAASNTSKMPQPENLDAAREAMLQYLRG